MTHTERNIYYAFMLLCILAVVGLLSSCGGWESINIQEGRHARFSATPQVHNWRAFKVVFTEESKYLHNNVNQYDWNKLRGFYSVQACIPASYADCGMIGWRWNPDIDSFQVTPYTHFDCNTRPKWEDGINVALGDTFLVQIEATDKWRYWIEVEETHHFVHPRNKDAKLFKQMNGYFGGDEKAPHKITYYVKDLKQKQW